MRDSATLLDATAGPDLGDPYVAPAPERPFAAEVGRDPGRLRIGFSLRPVEGHSVHPDCVAALHDAARLCEDLGHTVVERDLPYLTPEVGSAIGTVWAAAVDWILGYWIRRLGRAPESDEIEPLTREYWEESKAVSGGDYLTAVETLQRFSRSVARFLTTIDVWLTPTLAQPPLPLGSIAQDSRNAGDFVAFAGVIANITGGPAMSVPLHWSGAGLPIGVHFLGRHGDDALLLRLAGQLEAARPWAHRWPGSG